LPSSIVVVLDGKRYFVSSAVPKWKKLKV
jgi:hypothetical protein